MAASAVNNYSPLPWKFNRAYEIDESLRLWRRPFKQGYTPIASVRSYGGRVEKLAGKVDDNGDILWKLARTHSTGQNQRAGDLVPGRIP